jgi:hypothetical protein
MGLGFMIRYCSEPEVLGNRLPPVWVRARQLGDRHHLWSGFLPLASYPGRGPQVDTQYWCRVTLIGSGAQHR